MTKRDFFTAIVDAYDVEPTEAQWEELKDFAMNEIVKMDERNARRKNQPSKKSLENEPIKAKIVEILGDEPMTASDVAEKVEISVQKASALLRQIEGLTVTEVKVKGKGKVKGYALA